MRFTEEEYQEFMERRNNAAQPSEPVKSAKPRRGDPEHQEQKALIDWCDLKGHPYNLVFAIPNGGGRGKAEAGKLKAEGVKAGVPDLFLPVARGDRHGLFIEMKAKGGSVRSKQAEWHEALLAQGYAVAVAYGWEQAGVVMATYLEK